MAKALGPTFALEGLPGFANALERATDEIRGKVAGLMEQTAYNIRDAARAKVSVAEGDLRENIIVVGKGLRWRIGISDAVIANRGGDRIHQRPFLYGWILEHGSVFQGAKPFMRPSADSHIARFQDRLSSVGLVI